MQKGLTTPKVDPETTKQNIFPTPKLLQLQQLIWLRLMVLDSLARKSAFAIKNPSFNVVSSTFCFVAWKESSVLCMTCDPMKNFEIG